MNHKKYSHFFSRARPQTGKPGYLAVPEAYWSLTAGQLLAALHGSSNGLKQGDARNRLRQTGLNTLKARQRASALGLLLNQFKSPLVLILIFAAIVSAFVREWTDAVIVLAVVIGSTLLGFMQEYRAGNAVERLRSKVTIKSSILRDGQPKVLPSEHVVPGDVVLLSAGSLVPADGVVLEANDFFVNQAVLTGESFPVEKKAGIVPAKAGLAERSNCVFMGTSAGSGTARVLIVQTGKATIFGHIADRLRLRPEATEFERGIQRFGYLLTQVMLVMVVIVLAVNIFLAKPPIDSLLFALALAVGLAPELLPAIISITLAHGAQRMAKRGVIVRRLNAIENFGSMDVLCTDKTGTLTEGVVRLDDALDPEGRSSSAVLRQAYLNAFFQTGLSNPLDAAIVAYARKAGLDIGGEQKVDEIPYDFVRKRLSVVTAKGQGERTLISKGALKNILSVCSHVQAGKEIDPLDDRRRAGIERRYSDWSSKGYRVLGVATKPADERSGAYEHEDENGLTFTGFLLFFDPPKADVRKTIIDLVTRGVQLKIITGDNDKVARHVAEAVNLPAGDVLTGSDLNGMRDEALWHAAERTTIFAEVDPNQKERIILALRKTGHVVGYMGDGINDAPALHAADVGISVDTAVDVAKEAADFVLLKQDLGILREGVDEGRKTFANTLKYILTTISANFGNMFSMAGASLLLPFLPLLAPQILLNNFLSDIPGTAIAGDNVDPEWVAKPRRWNTAFIRDYMVLFGLVSSLFDFLAFAILLFLFRAGPSEFRTGWFIESLLTELVIALVVRTRHLFFRSRPGTLLLASTLAMVGLTLMLPYLPFHSLFGFVPLPAPLLLAMIGLTTLYVAVTEAAKKYFYSRLKNTA
ncbi:MAG: magnesium-translocating P-type ATPase [Candidatus Aminicenantes bacterium]|nr:magnesium-translocating P-type ATPase [Candidatus Aminicenantes bacterium]